LSLYIFRFFLVQDKTSKEDNVNAVRITLAKIRTTSKMMQTKSDI